MSKSLITAITAIDFFSHFNFTGDYDKKLKQLEQEVSTDIAVYCLKSNSKKIEVCDFMFPRLSLFLLHQKECGPKGKREDEVIKLENEFKNPLNILFSQRRHRYHLNGDS